LRITVPHISGSIFLFHLSVFSAAVHQWRLRVASTFHLHNPPFKHIYYIAFEPIFSGLLTEKLAQRIAGHAKQPFFGFLYLPTRFFRALLLLLLLLLLLALSVGHALILTRLRGRGLRFGGVGSWVTGRVSVSDVVCLAAQKYSSECQKSDQHFFDAPYNVSHNGKRSCLKIVFFSMTLILIYLFTTLI